MTQLRIAKDLQLPLEIVTERSAFIGRAGQGKSYAAQKLAELLHAAGAQFIVLDPVGIWWGLRLAANGKDPGLEVPVIGGLHGDIPLEPGSGKLLADLAVDRRLSMVLDVSQIEHDTDRNRFAREFGDRFFFRKKAKPSAVLLFLEEGQEFVPQNPGPKETDMLRTFTRIAKIGRNFGVGVAVITQRPQEVNKKVLNLSELLLVFQLTGKHERQAVEAWIEDKSIDEDIAQELPKLEKWHPHAWSPAWLKISKVVAIGERWTFDASSTPKVGGKAEVKELAPIDLEQLRKQMAATIERAKAEDPKELRRRIAQLEAESRSRKPAVSTPAPAKAEIKVKEVPVLKDGQITRLEKFVLQMVTVGDKLSDIGTAIELSSRELAAAIRSVNGNGNQAKKYSHSIPQRPVSPAAARLLPPATRTPTERVNRRSTPDASGLTAAQRRILSAIAWLEQVGMDQPDKVQVALFAELTPGAGHTNNSFGGLRSSGLIEYPTGGTVTLTDAGRAQADPGTVPQTAEEMQKQLLDRLTSAQAALLTVLIEAYPDARNKEDVAVAANLTPGAGHTNNSFGRLRSLGLIDYPRPNQAVALPVLFLEAAHG